MNFSIFDAEKFIFNLCFLKKFFFFLGEIVIIFYIFLHNFIQNFKSYTWVELKVWTKSGDEFFFKD